MNLDPPSAMELLLRLGLAFLLGVPPGWVQERVSHAAGLRTYPLLAAGICGFLLLGRSTAGGVSEQADYFYGVLTGIGFVGSGALLKSRHDVTGMGTAVSLWVTGAIGAGVAYGASVVAVTLSLLCTVALWVAARRRGLS